MREKEEERKVEDSRGQYLKRKKRFRVILNEKTEC